MRRRLARSASRAMQLALLAAAGADLPAQDTPHGSRDIGVAVERTQASAPGGAARTRALPYLYGDWGRVFVRVDTFGVKLVPLGWGALELVGRASSAWAESAGG